ncbi:DNA-binding CsgD family transcriptional regulator [Pseudomonas nitritireducens]|uniref:DNA-binding CsgD family transcriptional regulator n=1 Tax=Pseudomonas nitroreducens TaxID=46680 RepID=A0A7W7P4E6_PSENT|nr:helix-turn-helix domain-containing protein [Pseudomonas nitritireducens]MBB4867636.1 DNA-binding CsgD family transcriptional regulator [Pseudomonas nitritireducens]
MKRIHFRSAHGTASLYADDACLSALDDNQEYDLLGIENILIGLELEVILLSVSKFKEPSFVVAMVSLLKTQLPNSTLLIHIPAADITLIKILTQIGVGGVILGTEAMTQQFSLISGALSDMGKRDGERGKFFDEMATLTTEERKIVSMFMSGLRVCEIARSLSKSIKTVSAQKISGMRKLGVKSNIELLVFSDHFK